MSMFRKLVLGALALVPVASFAAVDAAITTAIDGAQADGEALVTAFAVAGAAVWITKRVLGRFGLKM